MNILCYPLQNRGGISCYPILKSHRAVRCARSPRLPLLPVWMLNPRWNGKNYMFAMNGQTGRMVGDLPVDRKRFWGLFAAVAAPMTAVLTALLYFM